MTKTLMLTPPSWLYQQICGSDLVWLLWLGPKVLWFISPMLSWDIHSWNPAAQASPCGHTTWRRFSWQGSSGLSQQSASPHASKDASRWSQLQPSSHHSLRVFPVEVPETVVQKQAIPKFPVWIPDPQNTQALKKLFYTINLWDDLFSGNSNCNTETEILSQNLPHLAWALTLSSILLVPKCRGGPFLIYP